MSTLLTNKKAKFDYEVLEEFEAGLALLGTEVKALKGGRGSLAGSYVGSKSGEFYLMGADVPAHQPANAPKDYNQIRDRKLLLSQKEIAKLIGVETKRGFALVPLSIYTKGNKVKLGFAIARGKKVRDKRETIKKRIHQRDMEREIKSQR